MEKAQARFFDSHPDPMWIYDLRTLHFLEVNNAAIAKYGYSRAEFLAMTIADIRPEEDVAALRDNVAAVSGGRDEAGTWRHRLKSGAIIHVDITSHAVDYQGRRAEVVAARDVSRLVEAEQAAQAALARERAAREASETLAEQFRTMFESVPGMFLVLAPDSHAVVAASDAFLATTGQRREDLVGRDVFAVFPREQGSTAHDNLRDSLARVATTGETDVMSIQCYAIPRADDPSVLEDRYWSAVNAPLRGADGRVLYIFHRAEEVTEAVLEGRLSADHVFVDPAESAGLEIVLRSSELKSENRRLAELAARLRIAQNLLGIGYWDYDIAADLLTWSDDIHAMYGVAPGAFGGRFEDYVALVQPEDRAAMRDNYAAFVEAGGSVFEFAHRVCRPDGGVIHVHGIAERVAEPPGEMLTGVVQDVTDQVTANAALARANRLLEIAGESAKFGAWRYDALAEALEWSPQTARIHDEPEDTVPTIEAGINYYAPEYRARIAELFTACLERGAPFDEVLQILTATGRRIWVRSTGEPEYDASGRIAAVQGSFQDISELIAAREQAEALSNELAETLENIGDAFLTIDRDWRFTYLNSQAERLLERDRESLLGRNVWAEFPEAAGSPFETEYRRALDTGESARFEQFYAPLDRWFRLTAHPTPAGLAVYFADITDQRRRDEQLRLLEAAVARLNDIVLITEAEPIDAPDHPRIVYVNDAFERRTGYTRAEAIGKTPRMLQGPKTDRTELDRIRRSMERWQPMRTELINYTKAGDEFWLELEIVPIADADGWYTHWVAVERDVTDRKQTEAALRLTEERFRLIAQATNDVIWDWDLANERVWWNDTLQEVFGYDPRTWSKPEALLDSIHPDDRERVVSGLHAAVTGSVTHWHEEFRFLHADGRVMQVVDRAFLIRDGEGRAIRMIGSMTDVTAQREVDRQLREAQKLEAVGQLTGGVAHDFNNLLTVILGNAELLVERLSDDEKKRMLAEMIESAAERGAELTNRLLAFARRQPLQPQRVDVNRLVGGMESLLRRTLSESISIEFVRSGGLWTAEIDPTQLETAILNLALNARDAMPDGGYLTVETANAVLDDAYARQHAEVAPGQYVVIAVSDSGTGMSEDVLARVFEPFFTTKPVGQGSGLGMSMVFGFVKQSRGHAKIYSEPGKGTTVKLYFPRAHAPGETAGSPAAETAEPGGYEHVLVVEDDPLVREHVQSMLAVLGYRTTAAGSGPEAVEIVKKVDDIDLLFTDVVMPEGMDGRELADIVTQLRPDVPVLFTSGYTENAIVHHGRLDPGRELLQKPYRRRDLALKLRRILDAQT